MPAKTKRSVDEIFGDLDNIGRKKPSFAESGLSEDAPHSCPHASSDDDGAFISPALKQRPCASLQSAGTPTPQSEANRSHNTHHTSSARGTRRRSVDSGGRSVPSIVFGSPTLSDLTEAEPESAFASELTTMHRKAEETADHAVYCAEAVARASGSNSQSTALLALAEHINSAGLDFTVRSLRNSGQLKHFLSTFVSESTSSRHQRTALYDSLFCSLLKVFLDAVSLDLVPIQQVFQRLLPLMNAVDARGSISEPVGSAGHKTSGLAAAISRATVKVEKKHDALSASDVQLMDAIQRITTCEEPVVKSLAENPVWDCEKQAVDIMTNIVLQHNNITSCTNADAEGIAVRSLSNLLEHSAAVVFVESGGLNGLVSALRRHCARTLSVLQLGTLVTCDPDVAKAVITRGDRLRSVGDLVIICGNILSDGSSSCRDVQNEALRILINVTSSMPSLIPKRNSLFLEQLCGWIKSAIHQLWQDAHADDIQKVAGTSDVVCGATVECETATLGVCLAINLLEKGRNIAVVESLMKKSKSDGVDDVVSDLAQVMCLWHEAHAPEQNVVAGYVAMMLACISLCRGGNCTAEASSSQELCDESQESVAANVDYRVVVVTAISKATFATWRSESGVISPVSSASSLLECSTPTTLKHSQLKSKPMKLVVAILQEFIMFQSSAGILTRDVLVAVHHVIQRLVDENHIELQPEETDHHPSQISTEQQVS